MNIIKEACVENPQEAILAEKLGANRIELCSSLHQGGLTPDRKSIQLLLKKLSIPLKIMIRPRAGDFNYSEEELIQMESDILFCKKLGVKEVVFGVLDKDKRVDTLSLNRLVNISLPMKITFHKAIDNTDNIFVEMDKLVNCDGVTSILTSGKGEFILENKPLVIQIIEKYKNKTNIILAGAITCNNFDFVHKIFQWNEYHGRRIIGNLNN